MRRKPLLGLAAAVLLMVGMAGCGSSSSSSNPASDPNTLVIEDNPISPFTRTFNPFETTSTGYEVNAVGMIYEPLLQFNVMRPNQVYPWLAQSYAWSNDGKTLTFKLQPNAKWSDGQAFTSQDVAFTYNLVMRNKSINMHALKITSVQTPDPTTAVLNFDTPNYTNLYFIASTYIVPQHLWQSVGDPATYDDPNPVGTGPYLLDTFSPQNFTLKLNPTYWQPGKAKVQRLSFPSFPDNNSANLALGNGQIDWGGNFVANIQQTYLDKNPNNHKFFAPVNVVTLELNTTKGALGNPAVRKAISAAIDRNELSTKGESGYEAPASTSGGLLLPTDNEYLAPQYANDLAQNKATVSTLLTGAGYTMQNGKWTDASGHHISFAVEDPSSYTDYFQCAQLISQQLNSQGFDVTVNGTTPNAWTSDLANGTFDAAIHWGNQGPSPYYQYEDWLDYSESAPIGQAATGDFGRFNNPEAEAALTQFANSNDPATQKDAINKLQQVMAEQAPVIPLLYGAAWDEYSTAKFTGWPTEADPYMNPTPNSPFMEYTILQLVPATRPTTS